MYEVQGTLTCRSAIPPHPSSSVATCNVVNDPRDLSSMPIYHVRSTRNVNMPPPPPPHNRDIQKRAFYGHGFRSAGKNNYIYICVCVCLAYRFSQFSPPCHVQVVDQFPRYDWNIVEENPSAASGKVSTTMDSPKFEEAATDFTERGQGRSRTDGGWKKMAGFDGDFDGLRKNWN